MCTGEKVIFRLREMMEREREKGDGGEKEATKGNEMSTGKNTGKVGN